MVEYDNPTFIELFRLKALRGALKLEILGMRRNGRSAYAITKEEFGFNNILVFKGGWRSWSEEGLEVEYNE